MPQSEGYVRRRWRERVAVAFAEWQERMSLGTMEIRLWCETLFKCLGFHGRLEPIGELYNATGYRA